jgi:hypothetical protein
MPNHSASGDPRSSDPSAGEFSIATYPAAEWQLLIRLPGRVVVAATSADPISPRRTVAEGLAGLEGIAAGRGFDSELVRAVAAAIYAESEHDGPVAEAFTHRTAAVSEVLAACREVVGVLAGRADPADSAAYRQWVQSIAARVCQAVQAGGVPSIVGEQLISTDRRFLDDLGSALGLLDAAGRPEQDRRTL